MDGYPAPTSLLASGLARSSPPCALAGYAFARFRFRFHTTLFLGIMLSRAVPGVALSLPLFLLFNRVGLTNNVLGLALVYVAVNIPFTAWLMDGFFRQIPQELTESAYIDGCGYWSAFWRIELPLRGGWRRPPLCLLAALEQFKSSGIGGAITRRRPCRPACLALPPSMFTGLAGRPPAMSVIYGARSSL